MGSIIISSVRIISINEPPPLVCRPQACFIRALSIPISNTVNNFIQRKPRVLEDKKRWMTDSYQVGLYPLIKYKKFPVSCPFEFSLHFKSYHFSLLNRIWKNMELISQNWLLLCSLSLSFFVSDKMLRSLIETI